MRTHDLDMSRRVHIASFSLRRTESPLEADTRGNKTQNSSSAPSCFALALNYCRRYPDESRCLELLGWWLWSRPRDDDDDLDEANEVVSSSCWSNVKSTSSKSQSWITARAAVIVSTGSTGLRGVNWFIVGGLNRPSSKWRYNELL